MLYGRGAVDMKGAIACTIAAALDYLAANGGKPKGSISFLITGDEEGIAVNGTVKLLRLGGRARREIRSLHSRRADQSETLGDMIKIGRRGSQNGTLIVTGKQGHVAYPERADNPVRGLVDADRRDQCRAARQRHASISARRTSNSPRSTSATRPSI